MQQFAGTGSHVGDGLLVPIGLAHNITQNAFVIGNEFVVFGCGGRIRVFVVWLLMWLLCSGGIGHCRRSHSKKWRSNNAKWLDAILHDVLDHGRWKLLSKIFTLPEEYFVDLDVFDQGSRQRFPFLLASFGGLLFEHFLAFILALQNAALFLPFVAKGESVGCGSRSHSRRGNQHCE